MNTEAFDYYVSELLKRIQATGETLEGNCVYEHLTFQARSELKNKQLNLFEAGKRVKHQMIEIGFNGGHSALLFLMAAPPNTIFHFFDIGEHKYVQPCFEYLQSVFTDKQLFLHVGDSRVTLPQWIRDHPNDAYDVVHVDGGHTQSCIESDTNAALQLCAPGGILIMDDTQDPMIQSACEQIVSKSYGIPVEFEVPSFLYPHRLFYKV